MIFFENLRTFRKRVWTILEPADEKDSLSKFIDIFLVCLIFFNILMVILETVETLYLQYEKHFYYMIKYYIILSCA